MSGTAFLERERRRRRRRRITSICNIDSIPAMNAL
jgi:hypothetical protein